MPDRDGERRLTKVGNYTMTGRVLGKGHFARVQEATHIHLNVKVAVKVLTFREVKDDYIIKNMRREAKILAKVSHPNIIYLFETITTTKRYYIITELVNGGDLCTFITSQRNGKLDEKQTRPLARQIISAVAHLHERGIVHRDLKMENILLDDTKETIKLVDFGLSNYRRGIELLHTHCGSPEYAAPELYISGLKYGAEVDIWSLGVIFYGMLVGRLPFQSWHKPGLTPEAKRKQLIRETKIGLTHRHQKNLVDISLLFRNLIERMLCPNPEDRITMLNLQAHAWIYGRFHREYPQVDVTWKQMVLARFAKMCDMSVVDVCRTIDTRRYSPLAGMFNIVKLNELERRIEAEDVRNYGQDVHKSHPIQNNHRPTKAHIPTMIPGANPIPSRPQNPVQVKKTKTFCCHYTKTEPKEVKTNPQQKTPFTLPNAATPRRCFTTGFGAAINRMIHKHRNPPTKPIHCKKVFPETKTNGFPTHTAARAAARAEFDKRAGRKQ